MKIVGRGGMSSGDGKTQKLQVCTEILTICSRLDTNIQNVRRYLLWKFAHIIMEAKKFHAILSTGRVMVWPSLSPRPKKQVNDGMQVRATGVMPPIAEGRAQMFQLFQLKKSGRISLPPPITLCYLDSQRSRKYLVILARKGWSLSLGLLLKW